MTKHLHGIDVLGSNFSFGMSPESGKMPAATIDRTMGFKIDLYGYDMLHITPAQFAALSVENRTKADEVAGKYAMTVDVTSLMCGVAGLLLWPAHKFLGFLIGYCVFGIGAGYVAGHYVIRDDVKQLLASASPGGQ